MIVKFGLLWQNAINWVAYEQQNLFLTILETGSLNLTCLYCWILDKVLFWIAGNWLLTVSSYHGKKSYLAHSSFHKRALITFIRAPPSQTNYLSKAPPPNSTTLKLGFLFEFWRHVNIQSTAKALRIFKDGEQTGKSHSGDGNPKPHHLPLSTTTQYTQRPWPNNLTAGVYPQIMQHIFTQKDA